MAVIAARLVEPGIGILADVTHGAVTAGAVQPVLAGHDIAQAFRVRPRVAAVAAIGAVGDHFSMLFMHGI